MGWQRWRDVFGPLPNRLHSSWLIWSGGEPITTLFVLTNPFEWCSCSHESEGATWWRNATGNGLQPWPPGEPIDDGRRARCSLTPCRRFPLERQGSQRWLPCHLVRESVKTLAEEVGWSLASGKEGLSGLSHDKKRPKEHVQRVLELSTIFNGSTHC